MDDKKLAQKIKERKDAQERANRETSKRRLINNIKKKFNTTMIGSLSLIEEYFGELWGHNKEGALTQEEREYLEKWQLLRCEILDKGNSQSRAAINEISEYSFSWERYSMQFFPVSQKEGQSRRGGD